MIKRAIWGMGLVFAAAVQAANFTNLDFEAYSGSGTNLLPGWEFDTNGMFSVPEMDFCPLVSAGAGLIGSNSSCGTLLQGKYTALLASGQMYQYIEDFGYLPVGCGAPTIGQTAVVPADASFIRYAATPGVHKEGEFGESYDLLLQGALGDIVLSNGVTTDIRTLAGLESTLSFTIIGTDDTANPGSWHSLDQIEFLNAGGEVIWPLPPPYGPSARCLEDFHAGLNTSLWQVITVGQELSCSEGESYLGCYVTSADAPFETIFQYQPVLRGNWDVVIRYELSVMGLLSGTGNIGMGLCAALGSGGGETACVGKMADPGGANLYYMTDWGSGPDNLASSTTYAGLFRLHREGETISGLYWDSANTCWQTVGTAGGFTQESARVGLKVWNTGTFSGKGAFMPIFDDLMLVEGQVCLDGMAVKVFGLDSNGVPSVSWDSVGIAESNRYYVTKATNLLDPEWVPVSSALTESPESNSWTGTVPSAPAAYYRIEVEPAH